MSETTTDLIHRASQALEAKREVWRKAFAKKAGEQTSRFAKLGGLGGADHQRVLQKLCGDELHRRSVATVDALLSLHKKLSESPRDSVTTELEEWIGERIKEEAKDLQVHLPGRASGSGDSEIAAELEDSCKAEILQVSAHVDTYMSQLRREKTERGLRRAARALAWVRKRLGMS